VLGGQRKRDTVLAQVVAKGNFAAEAIAARRQPHLISLCNNLRQYGIPFTLTTQHVCALSGEVFEQDLRYRGASTTPFYPDYPLRPE
jgi:L-fucose isomerase-like protein